MKSQKITCRKRQRLNIAFKLEGRRHRIEVSEIDRRALKLTSQKGKGGGKWLEKDRHGPGMRWMGSRKTTEASKLGKRGCQRV